MIPPWRPRRKICQFASSCNNFCCAPRRGTTPNPRLLRRPRGTTDRSLGRKIAFRFFRSRVPELHPYAVLRSGIACMTPARSRLRRRHLLSAERDRGSLPSPNVFSTCPSHPPVPSERRSNSTVVDQVARVLPTRGSRCLAFSTHVRFATPYRRPDRILRHMRLFDRENPR